MAKELRLGRPKPSPGRRVGVFLDLSHEVPRVLLEVEPGSVLGRDDQLKEMGITGRLPGIGERREGDIVPLVVEAEPPLPLPLGAFPLEVVAMGSPGLACPGIGAGASSLWMVDVTTVVEIRG